MASVFLLPIMFAVAAFFIYRDAYDNFWRIVGMVILSALLIFVLWLFLFAFKTFGFLTFEQDKIILHSPFAKRREWKYEEYVAVIGEYTSVIERKKAIILTPRKLKMICAEIDTSKFGNVIQANKAFILYSPYDEALHQFLEEKYALQNDSYGL